MTDNNQQKSSVIKAQKKKETFESFLEIVLTIIKLLVFDVIILICFCIAVCAIAHINTCDEKNTEPIRVVSITNSISVEECTETYLVHIGDFHEYYLNKNIILRYWSKRFLILIILLLSNAFSIYWDGYTSGLWGENVVIAVLIGIPIILVNLLVELICYRIPNACKSVRQFFQNKTISKKICDDSDDTNN